MQRAPTLQEASHSQSSMPLDMHTTTRSRPFQELTHYARSLSKLWQRQEKLSIQSSSTTTNHLKEMKYSLTLKPNFHSWNVLSLTLYLLKRARHTQHTTSCQNYHARNDSSFTRISGREQERDTSRTSMPYTPVARSLVSWRSRAEWQVWTRPEMCVHDIGAGLWEEKGYSISICKR